MTKRKQIEKAERLRVYYKYDGRCAYCGAEITLELMQVDHIVPKSTENRQKDVDTDQEVNYNPSCQWCNAYKGAMSVEEFRQSLETLDRRMQNFFGCKVAERYGLITFHPHPIQFYYESRVAWPKSDEGQAEAEALRKAAEESPRIEEAEYTPSWLSRSIMQMGDLLGRIDLRKLDHLAWLLEKDEKK